MYDIVVLGAGVVGLSTAVNIQEQVPNRHVTLIADKFNTETTSDGAAGMFRPTLQLTPEKSLDRYRKWCTDSFAWYHEVNTKFDPKDAGIIRVSGYEFSDYKRQPPFHHDIIYDFRELTEKELKNFPGNQKYGWFYTTLMTECRRYLPWLAKRFLSKGGKIEQRTVNNIKEHNINAEGYIEGLVQNYGQCSLLVNCSGYGSLQLFNDKAVYPVRGHLIRVKAPWLKHFYLTNNGETYIYTGQDNVVLGGTRHLNVSDHSDSDKWFNDVFQRCLKMLPGLKGCEVVNKWVGLRPHRTSLRIEPEIFNLNGKKLTVVHNYGHGANGVALSWGTSVHAASIVKDLLSKTKCSSSAKL